MSSVHSSQFGMALDETPSEAPVPRRSKKMSRLNAARLVRNSTFLGTSHGPRCAFRGPRNRGGQADFRLRPESHVGVTHGDTYLSQVVGQPVHEVLTGSEISFDHVGRPGADFHMTVL